MKKLIVIAMLALTACAGMDRSPEAGKPIEYVLDEPGRTQDQLFSASKSWIAETFVSAKAVIDDADRNSGRIIAKGQVKHPCGPESHACGNSFITFTLRIDTKDGKIRMVFSDATDITPPTEGTLVGLTYVPGNPQYSHPLWMTGEIADARSAFEALSVKLQDYAAHDSAANKNW